jgi:hypothetical protein
MGCNSVASFVNVIDLAMTGEVLVLALYGLDMAQPEDTACAIYILLPRVTNSGPRQLSNY